MLTLPTALIPTAPKLYRLEHSEVTAWFTGEQWNAYKMHASLSTSLVGERGDASEDGYPTAAHVDDHVVISSDGFPLYTVDVSSLLASKGANQRVIVHAETLRTFAIWFVDEDYDGPLPDFFTPEDLNPTQSAVCGTPSATSLVGFPSHECQRPAGHAGVCQSVDHGESVDLVNGMRRTLNNFGFVSYCVECVCLVPSAVAGQSGMCLSCYEWVKRIPSMNSRDVFIIDHQHYMPGLGGFYGEKFSLRRKNGTRWDGELMTQGEIPKHFWSRMPDNAEWIETPAYAA